MEGARHYTSKQELASLSHIPCRQDVVAGVADAGSDEIAAVLSLCGEEFGRITATDVTMKPPVRKYTTMQSSTGNI